MNEVEGAGNTPLHCAAYEVRSPCDRGTQTALTRLLLAPLSDEYRRNPHRILDNKQLSQGESPDQSFVQRNTAVPCECTL